MKKKQGQNGGILIEMLFAISALVISIFAIFDLNSYLQSRGQLNSQLQAVLDQVLYATINLDNPDFSSENEPPPPLSNSDEDINHLSDDIAKLTDYTLKINKQGSIADYTYELHFYINQNLSGPIAYMLMLIRNNETVSVLNIANVFTPCASALIPLNLNFVFEDSHADAYIDWVSSLEGGTIASDAQDKYNNFC